MDTLSKMIEIIGWASMGVIFSNWDNIFPKRDNGPVKVSEELEKHICNSCKWLDKDTFTSGRVVKARICLNDSFAETPDGIQPHRYCDKVGNVIGCECYETPNVDIKVYKCIKKEIKL